MPSVFPIFATGYYGGSDDLIAARSTETYADGSYRTNLDDPALVREVGMKISGASCAERAAIDTIFTACMAATTTAGFECVVYDARETTAEFPDLTGAATEGRHTAIFLDTKLSWTRDGRDRFSTSFRMRYLN